MQSWASRFLHSFASQDAKRASRTLKNAAARAMAVLKFIEQGIGAQNLASAAASLKGSHERGLLYTEKVMNT